MKLESHYIFLPKDKPKNKSSYTKEDGTLVLNLSTGVGWYITQYFATTSINNHENIFKNDYQATIELSDTTFDVVFSKYEVGKMYIWVLLLKEKLSTKS